MLAKFLTNASGPPGGQISNYCKWRHLLAKFLTNAISNQCMWHHLFTKFASYKVPPVLVSTHGSVVPLAMFLKMDVSECYIHYIAYSMQKMSD